jgi:hypothetical protein
MFYEIKLILIFLDKTTVGQSPPTTNILIKGKNQN